MKGRLGDKIRIQHIIGAIHEIEIYLDVVSFDEFLGNSEKRFATIKQIEIIGEACNAITSELNPRIRKFPGNQLQASETFQYMNILV